MNDEQSKQVLELALGGVGASYDQTIIFFLPVIVELFRSEVFDKAAVDRIVASIRHDLEVMRSTDDHPQNYQLLHKLFEDAEQRLYDRIALIERGAPHPRA